MPHRGGLRLSVFALTCAVGLGAAASASASEVTLWTGPLHVAPSAGASVNIPPGLVLKQALLTRSTSFPEGSNGAYSATFKWYTGPSKGVLHTKLLDSATTNVNGDVSAGTADPDLDEGGSVAFDVTGAGASADLSRIALTVDDAFDPTAAIGGIGSRITALLKDPKKPATPDNLLPTRVEVRATDRGAGLWKAILYIDGTEAGKADFVDEGGAGQNCVNALNTGAPLPLANDCLANGAPLISFDSTQWPDGPHTLTVKLYDASGRVADVLKDYKTEFFNGKDPKNCSPICNSDLSVGSGGSPSQQNGGGNGNGGSGGVAGESTTSCNSPRLSMELSQKPLKVAKGVLVLRSGKRYRFRGKLTCLVGGKRRSAPVKTPIELFNTIGKRTYRKGGATVRANGKITIILAYKSSRTLVFRYTNPDGRRTQVKLKIKVVKRAR
jgi:hypothetical protein